MPQLSSDSPELHQLIQTLSHWQQGDCAKELNDFIYLADSSRALTEDSAQLEPENEIAVSEVHGVVLLTQTCDIVRNPLERPYLQVAPLIEVLPENLLKIKKGTQPRYLYIPGLATEYLVGDLDRILTIEKSFLFNVKRIDGCLSNQDRIRLGEALGRKFSRFAFPDTFTELFQTFQKRIKQKHSRQSEEGQTLRNLSEIRVFAESDWDKHPVKITLYFIIEQTIPIDANPQKTWDQWIDEWLALIPNQNNYLFSGMAVHLSELSAFDYVSSVPLDLDYLSQSS